jgi:DNA replication protein DnaC
MKFAEMDKMDTEAIIVSDAINDGLYLWGKSGRGKTYLASAIAKAAVDKRVDTRFASAVDMFTDLTNFDTDTLYRYTEPDLLIIDDLGAEKASEFRLEKLVQIMSAREYESKPTVVTSNLELVSRTGECLAAMWQPIGSIAATRLVSRLSALPKFNLRGVDRRLHVQTAS